jgi:hypothetical protein
MKVIATGNSAIQSTNGIPASRRDTNLGMGFRQNLKQKLVHAR